MKRLLITAFAPFDQRGTNQSLVIANQIQSPSVTVLELPVIFGGAFEVLMNHLLENTYDVLVCLGEGPSDTIALEHIALNVMHARIPDNDGHQPLNEIIDKESATALTTHLPLTQFATMLDQKKLKYHHSYSAGTYVCNDLFYRVMNANLSITAGFIHVSYQKENEQSNLESIQAIVDYLGE